jgi:hypothetical protein
MVRRQHGRDDLLQHLGSKPEIEFVAATTRSRSLAALDGCSFVEKLRKLLE